MQALLISQRNKNEEISFPFEQKVDEEKPDLTNAITHFMSALVLDEDNACARRMLGRCFWKDGRFENAKSEFERCLKTSPMDWECWNFLGVAHNSVGDFDKSITCFEKALKYHLNGLPDNFKSWKCFSELP